MSGRKEHCCIRCGYATYYSNCMKRHVNQKHLCSAIDEEHDFSREEILEKFERSKRKYVRKAETPQVTNFVTINNNNTFNGTVNIVHYRIPFNLQSSEGETKYIKNADLKEIVHLPLELSLQRYIQLRNFNSDSPACKNIMTVLNNRAMTVSEDFEWEADSARRCANVILDCYLERLTDFETVYPKNTWHDDVYELINKGMDLMKVNNWSSSDRSRPLQCILDALYIQSKREYPLGSRSLPCLSGPGDQ